MPDDFLALRNLFLLLTGWQLAGVVKSFSCRSPAPFYGQMAATTDLAALWPL